MGEAKISLEEDENSFKIRVAQLQKNEAEAAHLQDQLARIERAMHQTREEPTQVREALSQLADKVFTMEHCLTKVAAKGVKVFKQSEVFYEKLLT